MINAPELFQGIRYWWRWRSPLKWHKLILSSVPEPHFHRLGRNFHDSRKFREISGCLEHGTSSTPRIISNEKQSPNGLCFIVGGDGGSRTHVQEYFRKTFSERSRLLLFRLPVALRQTRGSLSRRYSYATGRSRKRSLHA